MSGWIPPDRRPGWGDNRRGWFDNGERRISRQDELRARGWVPSTPRRDPWLKRLRKWIKTHRVAISILWLLIGAHIVLGVVVWLH
jgi:hypothetical protein